MNKRSLRTKLALHIAPWLKPRPSYDWEGTIPRATSKTFNAPSEVTWKGSWADKLR